MSHRHFKSTGTIGHNPMFGIGMGLALMAVMKQSKRNRTIREPRQMTEREAWNAAVEAKKAAKKGRGK